MNISQRLQAYLECEFQEMLTGSAELEKSRKKDRKRRDSARKCRQRARDKALKTIEDARAYFDDDAYQKARTRVLEEYKKPLRKEGGKANPLKSKATLDFNNFIYTAYYLIEKEQSVKDANVYRWIEAFLKSHSYKMPDGKLYDIDAIKSRVIHYKKGEALPAIESLIEHAYTSV